MKPCSFLRFSLFFLLLTGIMLIAYSCKKDNDSTGDGSGYYMRFKINGTQVEYKGQVESNFNKVLSLQHNSSVAGLKEALVAGKNNMTLLLATDDDTQTGLSYTSYTTGASGMQKARLAWLGYFDESGTSYLSSMEELAAGLPSGTETNAVIKVTEAASGYIKGTFSGVVYNADYSKKLNVTEGEFYARRAN